jgi:TonB family protein
VGASGTVSVEIVVDEGGKVVSAHAVNGHPFLQHAAEGAARKWRFKPFLSKDQPIKVSGILEFRFTP